MFYKYYTYNTFLSIVRLRPLSLDGAVCILKQVFIFVVSTLYTYVTGQQLYKFTFQTEIAFI